MSGIWLLIADQTLALRDQGRAVKLRLAGADWSAAEVQDDATGLTQAIDDEARS